MKVFINQILGWLPNPFVTKLKMIRFNWILKKAQRNHQIALEQVRKKEKIKVVFFALHSSVWKYDQLYRQMLEHPIFEPLILVCPVVNYDKKNMIKEMEECFAMLKHKNFNAILSYDKENDSYVDVHKSIRPDIIFYTNPYRGLIHEKYYITKFPTTLTCYVPYSSLVVDNESDYDNELTNLLWKFFLENDYSFEMSKKIMKNKGQNVAISGFPSLGVFLDKSYRPQYVWKHKQSIKIIWAPHHTINEKEIINFSNFFEFSDIMVELAKKYETKIQIAFKPHPLLYIKLLNIWGKEKTDSYYDCWTTMPNTQFESADYIDLFITSDAMIFDSCSFLNEYLYTQKPSVFIINDIVKSQLNNYGLDAFECHQHADSKESLIKFIESLLYGYQDPLIDKKAQYYNKYIAMYKEQSASDRIISEICKSIYNNN